MKRSLFLWTAFLLCCVCDYTVADDSVHSRKRRMLWPTRNGRLALPTGTKLKVDFALSGVLSPLTMHLPFTIDFDELGWTDDENPFGDFFVQRMARSIGWMFTGSEDEHRRATRSVSPADEPNGFESLGIGRSIVYSMLENVLAKFGIDGKACLLRATCEIHLNKATVDQYGFAGKMIQSFFTTDESDDSMKDYVIAQMAGKDGDKCQSYFTKCPNSLFASQPILKSLKKRNIEDVGLFTPNNNSTTLFLTDEDKQLYGKNSTIKKRNFDEIDNTPLIVIRGDIKSKKKN